MNTPRAKRPSFAPLRLTRLTVVVLPLAAACVVAHIFASQHYMTLTGPLLVLDHGFDLLAPLALLALATGVGLSALRLASIPVEGAAERLLFAAAIGTGITATALLGVLAAAGVGALTIAGTLAVLALVCRRGLAALPALARGTAGEVLGEYGPSARWLVAAPTAAAAAVILLLALLPPTDWDSLAYHLEVPTEWLAWGTISLPPDNLHAGFVGLVHFLYLPLLLAGSLAGPAVLNSLFALLMALAVWVVGRALFDRSVATWAVLIVWASPILIFVGATPRVDVTLTFFLFLAQFAVLRAGAGSAPRKMLRLSAVLMGLAVGVKALALPFAIGMAPLVFWSLARLPGAARDRLREAWIYAGAAALAAAPWLLKNALLLGAPLYPVFSTFALEPWLRPLAPGGAGPALARTSGVLLRAIRLRFDLTDYFLRPGLLAPGGEGAAYFGNPLFVLVPLAAVGAWRRQALLLVAPAILYAAALLADSSGYLNVRYLIPLVPQLTIGAAVGIRSCGALLPWRRLRGLAAAVLAAVAFLVALTPLYRVTVTRAVPFAVGVISRAGFLDGFPPISDYYRVASWANRSLPRGSVTLMLSEARGVYFRHRTLADDYTQNWNVLRRRARRDGACLRELGLTHVLVNDDGIAYFERRGADLSAIGWAEFAPYASRCLAPLYHSGGITLYAIRPPDRAAGAASEAMP